MIPMVDLQRQYQLIKSEVDAAVLDVLQKAQYILGPNVRALEDELSQFLGCRHAISCASGTDALQLALCACGIGPGDEVITTPFSFIATAEAICYTGAKPVFVDIEPDTFNIDPKKISAAITEKTRAVIPVHLFGQPANLAEISTLCADSNLLLIEDCAQSIGADINGKMTGTFGAMGCFSFFPSKNLGCFGDGGLVTTDDDELAEQCRVFRNHGSRERYYHEVIGYNSRLDELQAAILRVKLKHLQSYNDQRRRVAARYSQKLMETSVTPPYEDAIGTHVYHQYTCLSDKRQGIMAHLSEEKIASAVYYPVPLHRQQAFAGSVAADISLPVTEYISERCFSLPIFPEMEDDEIDRIVAAIASAV
ncbi:MAG: DegT/DnrJ/EryC1/StrS family aminotransferase [Pseudomonadota bacterium]